MLSLTVLVRFGVARWQQRYVARDARESPSFIGEMWRRLCILGDRAKSSEYESKP
jgi:hypothetical protein